MLFNYTTYFLVLYYFSSSSPPKVRGVREELKLFLFYFFISTFYISLKKNTNVRNPLSLLSLFTFSFSKKTAGNRKNTTVFFLFLTAFSNQPTN